MPRPVPAGPARSACSPSRDRGGDARRPALEQWPDALVDSDSADHLKVSRMTVARVRTDHELTPHRIQRFKLSTAGAAAKVNDLCTRSP